MGRILESPLFFKRNRVRRVYKGGFLFHEFFGDESEDGFYPEEWVASVVTAMNKETKDQKEGLSIIENTEITLKELMEQYPKEMLGDRKNFGLLVKLLDSAIRLPVQAHPDKIYSRKYFQSDFGKTEMWLVIGTRENAKIYLGFKEKISKEAFEMAVERSYHEKDAMKSLLNEIEVKKGDVYLIPAKTVHAIGEGCLILEVQEPTDFTIQPEYWCGDYLLTEEEMYLGLAKNEAMECFDFQVSGEESIFLSKKQAVTVYEDKAYKKETLITEQDTPCFCVNRYTVSSEFRLLEAPSIYIVTSGNGIIMGKDYMRELKKGDYFFLPYGAKGNYEIRTKLQIELIECLPPRA